MDKFIFDDIIEYPNPDSEKIYNQLVGLDEVKNRLVREAEILLNPRLLIDWSNQKYGRIIPLVELFTSRSCLFIIAGDVGTGKTTLAESFGDYIARKNNLHISLFSLSLGARSSSTSGEMTMFMAKAFHEVKAHTFQLKNDDGSFSSASILMIDEADALAQSRDLEQMHHEDRAGVDGLIQGLDSITKANLPIIIIMCTNRLVAIDPAVRRRAAAIFELNRPNTEQRLQIFRSYLEGAGLNDEQLQNLAKSTGENDHHKYGYTYSDIVQKILPTLILDTFPDEQITYEKVIRLIEKIPPTPPLTAK